MSSISSRRNGYIGKPRSASARAGAITSASRRVPNSSSRRHHASSAPGTHAGIRPSIGSRSKPSARTRSIVAAAGAGPCPEIANTRSRRASRTRIGTSPPGPFWVGSSTQSANPLAHAATAALPPLASSWPPICAPGGWPPAPGPAGPIPVRAYPPKAAGRGPLPGLVFFHGGGFVLCNLDSHDGLCRSLANAAGCAVVSIDYRLAPEHPYPAAPEDCYAATQWVAKNGAELGIDVARLAIGGDSAGGNLTAVTALLARDRGGPALRFQLMIYPVTNFAFDTASYRENGEGYFLTLGMR